MTYCLRTRSIYVNERRVPGFPAQCGRFCGITTTAVTSAPRNISSAFCDALLAIRCADNIADHYESRRNESAVLAAKWELWDLASVAGVPGGVSGDQLKR